MLQGKLNLSTGNPFYGKWNNLVNIITRAFNLSEKERILLYKSKIARLVAAIPFLAACDELDRTAVTHLGIYMLIVRTNDLFFNQGDRRNIFQRVRMINTYRGGDRQIIDRGMNLLILSLLCDYERELGDEQEEMGKEPSAAGVWYLKEEKHDLINKIRVCEAPYMDEIITLEEAQLECWF